MLAASGMNHGGSLNRKYLAQSFVISLTLAGFLVALHVFLDQANALAAALRSFYLAGSLLKPGTKPEGILITLYAPAFIAGW